MLLAQKWIVMLVEKSKDYIGGEFHQQRWYLSLDFVNSPSSFAFLIELGKMGFNELNVSIVS
jgi:hypothetical protein